MKEQGRSLQKKEDELMYFVTLPIQIVKAIAKVDHKHLFEFVMYNFMRIFFVGVAVLIIVMLAVSNNL